MGWGANQYLRITRESTYGTYNASPGGSDVAWVRLVSDSAYSVRQTPLRQIIRSADGGNRRVGQVASRKSVSGGLSTLLYPTQTAFFWGAALTLSSGDLQSYTLDGFDGVQVQRVLGAKVQSLAVAGTAAQDYLTANLQFVAQSRTTTTLTAPTASNFPTEPPFVHTESSGLLSVGGTQTKYSSLGFTVKNTLIPTWDEATTISSLLYGGRDVDLSVKIQYLAATMRSNLESQSPLTVSAAWARTAGLTATLTCNTKNYLASVDDELPLGGASYQTISIQSFVDGASGDVSFTVA